MRRKLTYEYVKNYFEEQGCELIEKEYISSQTKMKYICNCRNINEAIFSSFKQGCRCRKCSGYEKFTYEYVCDYFKKHNCEFLDKKYKNNKTLIKYKCNCGEISQIRFKDFRKGQRCKKCKIEKISGKNNWNYNPNLTDEEREKNKTRVSDYSYKNWRTKVYKKDKYICQKCFQKDKYLNSHHIEAWTSNKETRLEESNGITFCNDCHVKFHKKYGYGKNNRQQLEDFLII